MSDILLYSAIVANQKAIRNFVKTTINPGAVIIESASDYQNNTSLIGYPLKGSTWKNTPISNCPAMVQEWKTYLTPQLKSYPNGFVVCDLSGYHRCGCNCSWVVPAGVTKAQFQLWGHGGGTSAQCCCGGAPFGPSGAYMVAQLNVNAGETYTICAGCAYCCYASQTTPGMNTVPTYVYGPGLSICADGGYSCFCNWHCALGNSNNVGNSAIPAQDGCGPTQCSGWNFCWDSGGDDTYIPHSFGTNTWYVMCSDTSRGQTYYGIPGMNPAFVIGADLTSPSSCSRTISTPIFGFENCVCTLCYTGVSSQGTGSGGCYSQACCNILKIPGVGGYAHYACGGVDASGPTGDSGRMGMVCVSYC